MRRRSALKAGAAALAGRGLARCRTAIPARKLEAAAAFVPGMRPPISASRLTRSSTPVVPAAVETFFDLE